MGRRKRAAADRPAPLYEQVKRHVIGRIVDGKLTAGARLPSEHELMARLAVSRMTVHRALRELSAQGLISRVQGVGSFVAVPPTPSDLMAIRDIAEEIASRGRRHDAEVVLLERRPADAGEAVRLSLPSGVDLFHSLILHFEDDLPAQLEERFVTPSFAPDYLSMDFRSGTTGRYLRGIAAPTRMEHLVTAVCPSYRDCELLRIGRDEPCLNVVHRTWVDDVPVTTASFTYPGARYAMAVRHGADDPQAGA